MHHFVSVHEYRSFIPLKNYLYEIELEFYGPVNTVKVMSSLLVSDFSQAGLVSKQFISTCAHTFVSKWQLPFLNQWKGKNDSRNDFMINVHKNYVA